MQCVRAKDAVMVRIGTGLRRKFVNISRDGADQIYVNHRHRAYGCLRAGSGGGGCLKQLQPPTLFFDILVKTTIGHGYGYISSLSFLMVTVVAPEAEYNNRKANI